MPAKTASMAKPPSRHRRWTLTGRTLWVPGILSVLVRCLGYGPVVEM
jgi:hypothetical protein